MNGIVIAMVSPPPLFLINSELTENPTYLQIYADLKLLLAN